MGPICSLDDLIDMVHRRARLMAIVVAVGCVFSLLFALSQRHSYQSTEVLQFTRPGIASDPTHAVSDMAQIGNLRVGEQRLMTRDTMLEIIDAYNLFAEFPDLKPDALLDHFRKAVGIEVRTGAHNTFTDDRANSVLSITVRLPVAFQAQLVAHDLGQRLIALNKSLRIDFARDALAFFVAQENRLAGDIQALENQISTLRNDNGQALPGISEARQTVVERRLEVVESQLAQTHKELTAVSPHRIKAQMGLRMEIESLAERLEVIELATVADLPVASRRKQIAIIGGILSVMLGLMATFVQELRYPAIRNGAQMLRETGIVPVISIPILDTTPKKESLWQRYNAWLDESDAKGSSIL